MCIRVYMHMYSGGALSWDTLPIQNQPFLCPKLPLYPGTCLRPVTLKPGDVLDHGIAWRVAVVVMAGGNAMLVMAVVVMRGGMPWRVAVVMMAVVVMRCW